MAHRREDAHAPEVPRLCELIERACQVAEAFAAIPPASCALGKRHSRRPVRDLLDALAAASTPS